MHVTIFFSVLAAIGLYAFIRLCLDVHYNDKKIAAAKDFSDAKYNYMEVVKSKVDSCYWQIIDIRYNYIFGGYSYILLNLNEAGKLRKTVDVSRFRKYVLNKHRLPEFNHYNYIFENSIPISHMHNNYDFNELVSENELDTLYERIMTRRN